MRNRAKCKLCLSVIESLHATDYVSCNCGEIAVDEGDAYRCYSKDFNNFLRVDDEGNEIVVKIKDAEELEKIPSEKPNKKQMIDMLDEMIKSYENLPSNAMLTPVTHYDLLSALLLLSSIFKSN